ncbi:MAG TPA: DUF350 domain-containing protein [Nocardioidaceae bacterium]|nr:DUF350 domain-containing protein [Nocardioidaceae bacterium]
MPDLLDAALHAVVYAVVGGALVVLALYVLDLLTPGHLGTHLRGSSHAGSGSARAGAGDGATATGVDTHVASGSAGVVAAAWLVGTGAIVFTAIWTNGETSLGSALLWTVVFGLLGIAVNTLMLVAVDLVTPGRLGEIVCTPGSAVPLAYVTAAAAVAVSAVVCASIA